MKKVKKMAKVISVAAVTVIDRGNPLAKYIVASWLLFACDAPPPALNTALSDSSFPR